MDHLEWASPEEVGLSSAGIDRIDESIQHLIDSGILAGAVTLVARHGRLVHLHAMGAQDIASGAPMQSDTLFRIFSMTKPVTATAMMILHDEGRWSLDDPISKHLPELTGLRVLTGAADGEAVETEPVASAPTLLQLLTHTAGFAYGIQPNSAVDKVYLAEGLWDSRTLAEFVTRLARLPLEYQPGSKWRYSLSMDVQGAIIERLSGQSLPDFFQQRIFGPLGMDDTAFHTPPEKLSRRATLYFSDAGGALRPLAANPLRPDYECAPALAAGGAGLVSTAEDYARYCQMLLNGGTWKGQRIVSAESIRMQMTNHLPGQMLQTGYGVGHQKIRPGFGYGFNGAVFTDPGLAGIPVGSGTYQWDGAAATWFWVDPANDLFFVGMAQLLSYAAPPLQSTTQTKMADAILK